MKRLRCFALAGILLVMIVGCQPVVLWGEPPLPPAPAPKPTNTASPTALPTLAPVALPTGKPTNAPSLLWIGPTIPPLLRERALAWDIPITESSNDANLYLNLSQEDDFQVTWIYALVAPFPTVTDDVSASDLKSAWNATYSGPFSGLPLLMDESTLAAFTAIWGKPAAGAVKVEPAGKITDTAWAEKPSWGIVPFEAIEPRWKVLSIDGQSPIRRNFKAESYPLVVHFRFFGSSETPQVDLPATNRDPSKLATVILTGVTALTRATAATMDVKGITFPGKDIREMMLEADIAHINNEVPFYGGCPDPDPNQPNEVFCSATRYIQLLTDIGTDVVELSGDHFADYGSKAMMETLQIYKENNLPYYGGGTNLEEGRKPLLMEVNGNKLMFIGCNIKDVYSTATDTVPGSVPCDFPYITGQIKIHRAEGYLPISTFQYHEFDSPEARPQQEIDFRTMAEAGAVIVSGSQAHVAQVMEFHNGAFIHYGLGNLFFDQMQTVGGTKIKRRGFIDRHVFYDGRYLGVELITTYLEDFSRPRYMTPEERGSFLSDYFGKSGW